MSDPEKPNTHQYNILQAEHIERGGEGPVIIGGQQADLLTAEDTKVTASTGLDVFEGNLFGEVAMNNTLDLGVGTTASAVGYAGVTLGSDTEGYVGATAIIMKTESDVTSGGMLRAETRTNGQSSVLAAGFIMYQNPEREAGQISYAGAMVSGGLSNGELGAVVSGEVALDVYRNREGNLTGILEVFRQDRQKGAALIQHCRQALHMNPKILSVCRSCRSAALPGSKAASITIAEIPA